MQKISNIALLFVAMLFIVLHNVTPHSHEHHAGEDVVQVSSSATGLLGGILLIDLGGDHLEAFSQPQTDYTADIVPVGDNFQITPLVFWLEYSMEATDGVRVIPLYQADYQEDTFLDATVLRGPPILG